MLRKLNTLIFLLLTFFYAFADETNAGNPVDLLNKTVVSTQDELIENSAEYQKDPYKLLELIKQNIVPIVAADVVAQIVVDSDKWNKATPEEKKEFIDLTTEMLTFTYAKNVAYAGRYKVTLYPFTSDEWKIKAVAIVNGKITNTNNGQSSELAIKLFKKDNQWKIYDINVAGVSILETYKPQFKSYKNVAEMNEAVKKTIQKIKEKSYPELLKDKNAEV